MKKLLAAIGGAIMLIAIGLIVLTFVTPTEFKVERETTIAKAVPDVFGYAKLLKNQNEWGPWVKRDPNIKQTYTGTDGEVGFVSSWDSNVEEVGAGAQELKKIETDRLIETELRFSKPFESRAKSEMTFENAGGSTKVKWSMSGSMPRPFNLMKYVMDMDKEIGKDFEAGLANLKSIMEKK